jgi:hypothetical protein
MSTSSENPIRAVQRSSLRRARRRRSRSDQEDILLGEKSHATNRETLTPEEQAYYAQNALLENPAMQTAQRQELLARVGQAQGNQQAQRVAAQLARQGMTSKGDGVGTVQRQPVTEVTFEDEPVTGNVHTLGADVAGVDVADDIGGAVNMMRDAWNMIAMRYLSGIDNFAEFMSFPSEAEAQADYLKAAFKFALDQGIGAGLDALSFGNPAVGTAFTMIKDFVKAMADEHDRARAAGEQVQVRNYIVSYRARATDLVTGQLGRLEPLRRSLLTGYQETLSAAPPERGARELGTPTATAEAAPRRVVTGPGAAFLNELQRGAERLQALAQAATTDSFTQRILERWVQTREETVESAGGGDVYMGGRIFMNMKFYKNGSNWSVEENPTTGRLAAPQASRTVDALHRVMQSQGKTVNDLDILKVLYVEVEDEIDWDFNNSYTFNIMYRNPDNIQEITPCVPHPVRRETMAQAPGMAEQAQSRVDLSSIRVSRLETRD